MFNIFRSRQKEGVPPKTSDSEALELFHKLIEHADTQFARTRSDYIIYMSFVGGLAGIGIIVFFFVYAGNLKDMKEDMRNSLLVSQRKAESDAEENIKTMTDKLESQIEKRFENAEVQALISKKVEERVGTLTDLVIRE